MNTVSQTFNWNRFVATLKKEVVENSRLLLFSVIGLYAFFTFFMILGNLISHNPKMADWEIMTNEMPQTFVLCVISFAVAIMASMAFKDLTTKKTSHKPVHFPVVNAREVYCQCTYISCGDFCSSVCNRPACRPHSHSSIETD